MCDNLSKFTGKGKETMPQTKVFPTERQDQPKICSFPRLEKFLPPNFYSNTDQRLTPPTKEQFSCYNPIKTSLLAVVIAPVPLLF